LDLNKVIKYEKEYNKDIYNNIKKESWYVHSIEEEKEENGVDEHGYLLLNNNNKENLKAKSIKNQETCCYHTICEEKTKTYDIHANHREAVNNSNNGNHNDHGSKNNNYSLDQ